MIGWFVQDDFRLRPHLTFNLSLRQDIFTTPTEVNGFSGALIHVTDAAITVGQPFISPKKTFSRFFSRAIPVRSRAART